MARILRRLISRTSAGSSGRFNAAAGIGYSPGRPELKDLRGVITGGSSGIGEAVALALLESGAKVVIIGSSEQTVARARDRLGDAAQGRIEALWGDLTRPDTLASVLDESWERLGGVDALVNSIGVYSERDPCEISNEEWQRCLNVNLTVPFFSSVRIGRKMIDQKICGAIVNIGSCIGIKPAPYAVHYGLTKAALVHMSRSLAKAWGPHGIRVNTVSPGITMTPMNAHLELDPARRLRAAGCTSLNRLAVPAEIAAAVLFLISPQSSYVTGSDFVADGGYVLS